MNNNELYHHGVLGMKWGVRRYQPYSTTGPRKGGKTGKEVGEAAKVESRDEIKRRKAQSKADKKAVQKEKAKRAAQSKADKKEASKEARLKKKEAKKAERIEKERQDILSDPKKLSKNLDKFSPKEINDAIEKINLKNRLRDARIEDMNTGKRYIDMVLGYADSVKKAYGIYTSISGMHTKNVKDRAELAKLNGGEVKEEKKQKEQKKPKYSSNIQLPGPTSEQKIEKVKGEVVYDPLKERKKKKKQKKSSYVYDDPGTALVVRHGDVYFVPRKDELYHHGIIGMKWGIRRFQPYGHGGYDPKHKGNNVGEAAKSGSDKSSNVTSSRTNSTEELGKVLSKKGFKFDRNNPYGATATKALKTKDAQGNDRKVNLEINCDLGYKRKWNLKDEVNIGELNKVIDDISNDFQSFDKKLRKDLTDKLFEDRTPWKYEESNLSLEDQKKDFIKNLGNGDWKYGENEAIYMNIDPVYLMGEVSYEDGGSYYGHLVSVEIDYKSKKIGQVTING